MTLYKYVLICKVSVIVLKNSCKVSVIVLQGKCHCMLAVYTV